MELSVKSHTDDKEKGEKMKNEKCGICEELNYCLCIWDYIYEKQSEDYIEIDGEYIKELK